MTLTNNNLTCIWKKKCLQGAITKRNNQKLSLCAAPEIARLPKSTFHRRFSHMQLIKSLHKRALSKGVGKLSSKPFYIFSTKKQFIFILILMMRWNCLFQLYQKKKNFELGSNAIDPCRNFMICF